jgi:hypothetical protein
LARRRMCESIDDSINELFWWALADLAVAIAACA